MVFLGSVVFRNPLNTKGDRLGMKTPTPPFKKDRCFLIHTCLTTQMEKGGTFNGVTFALHCQNVAMVLGNSVSASFVAVIARFFLALLARRFCL